MKTKSFALFLGPLLFAVFCFLPHKNIDDISWNVLAVALWMFTWWLSETVHLAVTALLPMVLFPVLGIMPLKQVTPHYANPLVYLFFGGFVLSLAIEKWNLHQRIALSIIKFTGTGSANLLFGFMLATAFLSMWISNTATTVMMLPIALSVIKLVVPKKDAKLAVLLLIGLAWSANIGGMATLIGTPPNLVFSGFLQEEFNREIFFSDWIIIGLPISATLLLISFFVLRMFIPKNERVANTTSAHQKIRCELKKLGKIRGAELRVAIVFVATGSLWIFRKVLVNATGISAITDTTIAVGAAILLFVIPATQKSDKRLLAWQDTQKLEWGILVLFGGGLALAAGIQQSIWVNYIGQLITNAGVANLFLLILVVTLIGVFLTEIVSNLAMVTALMPLVAAIAMGANVPFETLALPLTLGASCAFMLPMATPPNAIVFSSKRITVLQMAKLGVIMNVISTAVIALICYYLGQLL